MEEDSKKITEKQYEKKVIELAKAGKTPEKIGIELKNQNIHPNEFSKKISKILKENNLHKDSNLQNTEKKLERLKEHTKRNSQDKRAIREKNRIFSRLRKTKKYLKLPLK